MLRFRNVAETLWLQTRISAAKDAFSSCIRLTLKLRVTVVSEGLPFRNRAGQLFAMSAEGLVSREPRLRESGFSETKLIPSPVDRLWPHARRPAALDSRLRGNDGNVGSKGVGVAHAMLPHRRSVHANSV
jgi:hypothetical protein